ncbi:MAG: RyR domain-containing protein [Acidimicrobiales bacterium]
MRAWAGVRRWARLTWASYRGITPLVLLVVALGLGYVGYRAYFAAAGEPRPWYDLLYYDLQLLTFNTRSASDPSAALPWTLQVARFMAPLVAGYGALVGILRLFRDRFDQSRARFSRRHAVVIGATPTGLAFVRSLRADGRRVVLVDGNGSDPIAAACRELGALVLEADARHPESLVQAGLGAADHLVAVSGDDGTNVEVVVNARSVRRRVGRPLRCLAHIVDPDLWQLLRANELTSDAAGSIRIDCFNIYEHGARALLADHPPPAPALGRPSTVLVVGDGPLTARLVVQVVRRSCAASSASPPPETTLLGPGATGMRAALLAELDGDLCLRAIDAPLTRGGVEATETLGDVDIAYVCVESDKTAVVVAQMLRTCLPATPVVVSLAHSEGIVRLLEQRFVAGPPGLHLLAPFALLERTCHPDALLVGTKEGVAEALHARYRQEELAAGTSPADPRVARWSDLSPDRQESCRSQAASIGEMIRLIGCDLIPQHAPSSFSFTESEVARLARFEHARWKREREDQGWKLGSVRDDERRRSPLLVGWEDLPDEARATTRRMIANLPRLVEEAGYRIVRLNALDPDRRWMEPVARAIHERYLVRRDDDGQGSPDSALPWEDLSDVLRSSNRAQAADISRKLASIGCRVIESDASPGFSGFTATELEELSRQEHDRWVDERLAAGYRRGPRGPRSTPDLVGWDDLDEPRRELDREAVRAIPEVLAAAGMAIGRR